MSRRELKVSFDPEAVMQILSRSDRQKIFDAKTLAAEARESKEIEMREKAA